MLTLAKSEAEGRAVKSPTITEIANNVPRGAGLQMAEIGLGKLRNRRDAICDELKAAYPGVFETAVTPALSRDAIALLEEEKRGLEADIKEARIAVAELRLSRSRKVAAALDPARLDAARRLLAATDLLAAAYQDLHEIFEQVRAAGDPDAPRFSPPQLGMIWTYAKRVVDAEDAKK